MGAVDWGALGAGVREESLVPLMDALGALSVGFVVGALDEEGRPQVLAYNETFVRMTGGTPAGQDSAPLGARVYLADRAKPLPVSEMPGVKAATTGRAQRNVEMHVQLGDGGWRVLSVSAVPLPVAPRRMWFSIFIDVTETHQALLSNEQELRLALETAQMGTWRHDLRTNIMHFDERAQQHHGLSKPETTLDVLVAMIHPDDRAMLGRRVAETISPLRLLPMPPCELRLNLPGGQTRWLLVQSRAHFDGEGESRRASFVHGTSQDITERKRLEEQLLQAQKLETIGRLAGGVAHDFNNILVAILGYAELLEEALGDRPERQDVVEIRRAGERARELTAQLLAVARRQVSAPRQLDLNGLLRDSVRFLQRVVGEDVRVSLDLAAGQIPVMVDPTQVHQVVMNLAVNARDAMPSGGRLKISTGQLDLDEAQARQWLDARPGPHAVLSVSDSGVGIPAEVQAHIFEPFFTTKGQGRGTGLGLATVHGIVRQAGGFILAESEVGKGTTFRIHLPLSSAPSNAAASPEPPRALGGSERVLLVEDDGAARQLSTRVLREAGYDVSVASDATEALALARSLQRAPDLLLTDVVMPGMNGKQLAERMTRRFPGLLVLFVSGYSENHIVHRGIVDPGLQLLPKPFTPSQLLARVGEVLEPLRKERGDKAAQLAGDRES